MRHLNKKQNVRIGQINDTRIINIYSSLCIIFLVQRAVARERMDEKEKS